MLQSTNQGVCITLKVVPKASLSEIVGLENDALKIRLAALPDKGQANDELIRFLARIFKIGKSQISLVQGDKSRHKRVCVMGLTLDQIQTTIQEILGTKKMIWQINTLFYFPLTCLILCASTPGWSGEEDKKPIEIKDRCEPREEFSETKHSAVINGQTINYQAIAGNLLLKDEKCQPKASLFFISYNKEGEGKPQDRPITFCFNGGPGSSAVWLHLGLLGPRRVYLNEYGDVLPPYHLVDNEYSLLDTTDLVFIDPVSTGFSHAIPAEDAKSYHGVEEDIKSVAEFIRLYLTRYERWGSPKFIIGESYGTTRAAGLAGYLHDHDFIYINGIALISTVLNYQSIEFSAGNDLPYLLFLPSYTAAAWYHKKLPADLQGDLLKTLQISRDFVVNDYTTALFKGCSLAGPDKQRIIDQLHRLTGLSPEYIERSNLRIDQDRFEKELLRDQKKTIGRFDSRYQGIDGDAVGEHSEYDPSIEAVFGAFTATFNEYLEGDLKCKREQRYIILSGTVHPWDWGSTNKYLNLSETLRNVMTKNSHLRVFVASGYYDLATPFFATQYTFDHLCLDPSLMNHITMKYYNGGHMSYIQLPLLKKMKEDLQAFYTQTLTSQEKDGKAAESLKRRHSRCEFSEEI